MREFHLGDIEFQKPDYKIGDEVTLSDTGLAFFKSLRYSEEEIKNLRGSVTQIAEHSGGFTTTINSASGKQEVAKSIYFTKAFVLGEPKKTFKLGPKIKKH